MSAAETPHSVDTHKRLLKFRSPARVPEGCYPITLGWPVTAWRVLVPATHINDSDPLQRALLRLTRAGCHTQKEISQWLDITPDLVQTLQYLFHLQGFLKADGRITLEGERLLDDQDVLSFSDTSHEQAWMFRDTLSGDVVPFLHNSDLMEDRQTRATHLPDNHTKRSKPSASQIRDALRRYRLYITARQRSERLGQMVYPSEIEGGGSDVVVPGVATVIWEVPEFIYIPVHVFAFLDDPRGWDVTTGFHVPGLDRWFREKLQWVIRREPNVQVIIDTLESEASSLSPNPSLSETETIATENHPILRNPALADTLQCLAVAYRGVAYFEENAENIDTVAMRYQKVLEALLTACVRTLPESERVALCRRLTTDYFESVLEPIAARFEVELPNKFRHLDHVRQIQYMEFRIEQSLSHLALFLLLYASSHPGSPAEQAFKKRQDILVRIGKVAWYRNEQVHYRVNPPRDAREKIARELSEYASTTIDTFGEAFFGGR